MCNGELFDIQKGHNFYSRANLGKKDLAANLGLGSKRAKPRYQGIELRITEQCIGAPCTHSRTGSKSRTIVAMKSKKLAMKAWLDFKIAMNQNLLGPFRTVLFEQCVLPLRAE